MLAIEAIQKRILPRTKGAPGCPEFNDDEIALQALPVHWAAIQQGQGGRLKLLANGQWNFLGNGGWAKRCQH
jgi:hypothetical protein